MSHREHCEYILAEIKGEPFRPRTGIHDVPVECVKSYNEILRERIFKGTIGDVTQREQYASIVRIHFGVVAGYKHTSHK